MMQTRSMLRCPIHHQSDRSRSRDGMRPVVFSLSLQMNPARTNRWLARAALDRNPVDGSGDDADWSKWIGKRLPAKWPNDNKYILPTDPHLLASHTLDHHHSTRPQMTLQP